MLRKTERVFLGNDARIQAVALVIPAQGLTPPLVY
jgi:hypothetical protein